MCSAHFSDYMYVPVYLVFLTSVTSWITPILSLYLKTRGQGRLMSEAATAMGDRGSSLHWVSVEAFLAHTKGYRGSTAILIKYANQTLSQIHTVILKLLKKDTSF